jgi:hypothetical protein
MPAAINVFEGPGWVSHQLCLVFCQLLGLRGFQYLSQSGLASSTHLRLKLGPLPSEAGWEGAGWGPGLF